MNLLDFDPLERDIRAASVVSDADFVYAVGWLALVVNKLKGMRHPERPPTRRLWPLFQPSELLPQLSGGRTNGNNPNPSSSNIYSAFGDADDDDDDDGEDDSINEDEEDGSDVNAGGGGGTGTGTSSTAFTRPVWFLLLFSLTTHGELLSKKANRELSARNWLPSAEAFEGACTVLREALAGADARFAQLILQQEQEAAIRIALGDNAITAGADRFLSHKEQIQEICQAISMVSSSAEESYISSKTKMEDRRTFLWNKLNPQWSARDEAREQFESKRGEGSWENNPTPKRDHAQKRVHAEKELREIKAAEEKLAVLHFSAIRDDSLRLLSIVVG